MHHILIDAMMHKEYSLDPLSKYLNEHPNAKYSELYSICNAKNNNQKTAVRNKKNRLLKRKSGAKSNGEITSLTPESIEKLIKDKLNGKSNIPDTQIRMALDFL